MKFRLGLPLLAPLLFVVSACVSPPPAPPKGPSVESSVPPPRRTFQSRVECPDPALIDDLDRVLQARFRDVRDEDIANGRLGASRYAVLEPTHPRGLLRRDVPEVVDVIGRIAASGWISATYVADARRDGEGAVVGPIVQRPESWKLFQSPDVVKKLVATSLASKAPAFGEASPVALESRPVFASEEMCLRCHRRQKRGESLGVLVFAFRSDRAWMPVAAR